MFRSMDDAATRIPTRETAAIRSGRDDLSPSAVLYEAGLIVAALLAIGLAAEFFVRPTLG